MTLMPVTSTSAVPACSAKVGASRWIEDDVLVADRAGFVDRLADDVHDAAQAWRGRPARGSALPVSITSWPRDQAFGGVHGDGAHGVLAQMLGHFEHQADLLAGAWIGVGGLQRVQDRGQLAVELDVDDGADDLDEATFGLAHGCVSFSS